MRVLVGAVLVAFFIISLYLLYSWLQSTVSGKPWFVDWLSAYSSFAVFIGGVGLNLIPLSSTW